MSKCFVNDICLTVHSIVTYNQTTLLESICCCKMIICLLKSTIDLIRRFLSSNMKDYTSVVLFIISFVVHRVNTVMNTIAYL